VDSILSLVSSILTEPSVMDLSHIIKMALDHELPYFF